MVDNTNGDLPEISEVDQLAIDEFISTLAGILHRILTDPSKSLLNKAGHSKSC